MKELLVESPLPGYEPAVGAALWRLEDGRVRTLRLLADMPADFLDRQAGGNTISTILYHVALIEADWLFSEILETPVPDHLAQLFPADDRDAAGVLTVVSGESLDQHLARLRAVRETLLERLNDMSSEEFHRPRMLAAYDVSPGWVLHHLAQHEAEHRGEIGSIVGSLSAAG
jgi:uncharacterized damage-inducible protein DinB